MKREFLKELGLEQDVIDKIMAEHGKSVQTLQTDKDKLEGDKKALEGQNKTLDGQLKERDEQLKALAKMDPKELQIKIDQLQRENSTAKEAYEKQLKDQAFDFALDIGIAGSGAKNPKMVKGAIDASKLTLVDGKLIGLDEQISAMKTSDAYAFNSTDTGSDTNPANPDDKKSDPNSLSDDEFFAKKFSTEKKE